MRRSPAAAALLAVTLLVAITVLGGAGWLIGQRILTARAVEADLREADRLQQQSAFPEAGAALERAQSRLGDGGPFWLYPVVEAARRDQQFLVRLEAIRLNRSTLVEGQQPPRRPAALQQGPGGSGLRRGVPRPRAGRASRRPGGGRGASPGLQWAAHLVAALDDWAVCAADPARQDWLLGVAHRADPDPWRDRVRDPAAWRDGKALAELARAAPLAEQPVPLLLALGERLSATGEDGVGFLRRVREQYPDDFWANFTLALALHGAERRPGGDPAPALAYYQKALEIRPQAVAVLNDLGLVLFDKDWMWDNADGGGPGRSPSFTVVKNDPRFAPGFNNLGVALKRQGRLASGGAHVPGRLADRSPVGPRPFQPRRNPGRFGVASTRRSTTTGRPCGSIPISPGPTTSSVSPCSPRAGGTRWTTDYPDERETPRPVPWSSPGRGDRLLQASPLL